MNPHPAAAFTCPLCARVSHTPSDVQYQYCAACHQFFPNVGQRLDAVEQTLAALVDVLAPLVGHVARLAVSLGRADHHGLGRGGLRQEEMPCD